MQIVLLLLLLMFCCFVIIMYINANNPAWLQRNIKLFSF